MCIWKITKRPIINVQQVHTEHLQTFLINGHTDLADTVNAKQCNKNKERGVLWLVSMQAETLRIGNR